MILFESDSQNGHIKFKLSQRQISYHLNAESKNMIQMNLFTKQKQTHRHKKKNN